MKKFQKTLKESWKPKIQAKNLNTNSEREHEELQGRNMRNKNQLRIRSSIHTKQRKENNEVLKSKIPKTLITRRRKFWSYTNQVKRKDTRLSEY